MFKKILIISVIVLMLAFAGWASYTHPQFLGMQPADSTQDVAAAEGAPHARSTLYDDEYEETDLAPAQNGEVSDWFDADEPDAKTFAVKDADPIAANDPSLVVEYSVGKGEQIRFLKGKKSANDTVLWNTIAAISPDALSDTYVDCQKFENDSIH
jgi:hypothetical protein